MPTPGNPGILLTAADDTGTRQRAKPEILILPGADRLRLSDCLSPDSAFFVLAAGEARRAQVGARALAVRTLLHLPRVAASGGWVTRAQITQELRHTARWLREDVRATASLVPARTFSLNELSFEPIPAEQAEPIVSALHYLRSARPQSLNFALLDPVDRLPVTLCSVSPLEWKRVGSQVSVQFGIPRGYIWDVSRVYSCDGAPPNAISFLLGRVRSWFRRSALNADLLVTAVDPNLSFTGTSYRAANWQQWMTVQPRPYLYHQRRYISPRQLWQRFGASGISELQAAHPDQRFEQSRARLLDSLIFASRVSGPTEPVLPQVQKRLHR